MASEGLINYGQFFSTVLVKIWIPPKVQYLVARNTGCVSPPNCIVKTATYELLKCILISSNGCHNLAMINIIMAMGIDEFILFVRI